MIKSEKGSIVVESAIIFPIVIIVVLTLLTFVLYYHDCIILSLAIDYQMVNQDNLCLTDEISEHTFLSETYYEAANQNDRSGGAFYQEVPSVLNVFGISHKVYKSSAYEDKRIYRILFYEKIHDYIDMITLDIQAMLKLESIVDMIFKSLKKN